MQGGAPALSYIAFDSGSSVQIASLSPVVAHEDETTGRHTFLRRCFDSRGWDAVVDGSVVQYKVYDGSGDGDDARSYFEDDDNAKDSGTGGEGYEEGDVDVVDHCNTQCAITIGLLVLTAHLTTLTTITIVISGYEQTRFLARMCPWSHTISKSMSGITR